MPGTTRQNATDDPDTDPVLNSITELGGVLKQHFVDPILGTDDQWALAQSKAQAGDDSMLRELLNNPMAGWASPQPSDEPAPGNHAHAQWAHNQIMNQAMALAGSGVIAGEGAAGAGLIPPGEWYRGADNMRRFEVPDYQSKFDMPGLQQFIDERDKTAPDLHVIGEVGEVLDHPELYKHYPELKNLPVFIAPTVGDRAMSPFNGGQYIRPTEALPKGGIMLNPQETVRDANGNAITDANGNPVPRPATGDELHTVLMHEINHYIQDKEGFAGGTSVEGVGEQLKNAQAQIDAKVAQLKATSPGHPDIPKLLNESDNIDQLLKYDPYHLYSTTAGEVESFNVEDRLNAGKDALQRGIPPDSIARQLGLPTKTQAVPNKQQLVFPAPNRIKLQPVDHTPETAPDNPMMTRGFHGTPHDFDEFSNHAMGTGEGAQAYGWGHYFAGNPKVAADYQRKLAGNEPIPYKNGSPMSGIDALEAYFQPGKIVPSYDGLDKVISFDRGKGQWGGDWSVKVQGVDKAGNPLPGIYGRVRNHATYPRPNEFAAAAQDRGYEMGKPGQLLEVAMKPDEHELLDRDKPLTEQHEDLLTRMSGIFTTLKDKVHDVNFWKDAPDMTGAELYDNLTKHLGSPQAASQALHQAGIPGLKFLDAGSRQGVKVFIENAPGRVGSFTETLPTMEAAKARQDEIVKGGGKATLGPGPTHNYVIFDPSNIKITAKNGKRLIPIDHDPFAEEPPTK